MGKGGKKGMPAKGIMNAWMPPKMGGNKKMAKKAMMKGNAAPRNFKPSGKY